jgi:hypothetical protein
VTTVTPQGKKLPEGGMQETETKPLLSVARGGGYTTTAPQPPAAFGQVVCTMLLGHCITGGSRSGRTVTVKVHVARFVQASVTVQVTTVVPGGKAEPGGGAQTTVAGAHPPLTMGAGY